MPAPTYLGLAINPRNITLFYLSKRKTLFNNKELNQCLGVTELII